MILESYLDEKNNYNVNINNLIDLNEGFSDTIKSGIKKVVEFIKKIKNAILGFIKGLMSKIKRNKKLFDLISSNMYTKLSVNELDFTDMSGTKEKINKNRITGVPKNSTVVCEHVVLKNQLNLIDVLLSDEILRKQSRIITMLNQIDVKDLKGITLDFLNNMARSNVENGDVILSAQYLYNSLIAEIDIDENDDDPIQSILNVFLDKNNIQILTSGKQKIKNDERAKEIGKTQCDLKSTYTHDILLESIKKAETEAKSFRENKLIEIGNYFDNFNDEEKKIIQYLMNVCKDYYVNMHKLLEVINSIIPVIDYIIYIQSVRFITID